MKPVCNLSLFSFHCQDNFTKLMNSWFGLGEGHKHRMNEEKLSLVGSFLLFGRTWVDGESLRVELSSSPSSSEYLVKCLISGVLS